MSVANQPRKILIVEDDATISTLFRIKFEKEWYIVKICANWMDAVTQVVEFAPSIILLDIMMPSMDGFETLTVIRKLAPSLKTKIVMFSNLNNQGDIDRCAALWADAYLLKAETTPADAVKKVEELLSDLCCQEKMKALEVPTYCKCPNCGDVFETTSNRYYE